MNMHVRTRPSLKDFHELEPWLETGYQTRIDQSVIDGEFMLGMVNPNTNKRMYNAYDLKDIDKYYFCYRSADMVIEFIETCLSHVKPSRFAKFPLHESQVGFFRNLFGWKKRSDGFRRFRESLKYVPRKNSKSWDQGALCHIGMIIDGEQGVEVYNVASDKEQAKKVFDPFVGSIKNDEEKPNECAGGMLADYYNIIGRKDIKSVTANNEMDVCKPLANDENASHGANAHFVILDEIHAMSDGGMYEVAITSMSVRDQPLIVSITTADFARESFCNNKVDYAKRVCADPDLDPRFMPVLYYADYDEFDDDWRDENVWERVNPMLHIAKKMEYMQDMHRKACNEPTFTNTFKRLDLNMMTMSENQAYNIDKWRKCEVDTSKMETFNLLGQEIPLFLKGELCFAGMDNALKDDLNSLVLDFPEHNYILNWNWIPRKHVNYVKLDDKYGDWLLHAGKIEIDFEEIYEHMKEIFEHFKFPDEEAIGFDPNKSWEIRKLMSKDYDEKFIVTINQNVNMLSEPIKKTIGDVNNLRVNHIGNLLLTDCISNADIKENSNTDYMLVKPSGSASTKKKIDACVAFVMARALRMKAEEEVDYRDMIY